MSILKEKYNSNVVPALKKEFGLKNNLEVPKVIKVTLNSGLSAKRDPKFIDIITDTLTKVSGQKPVTTKARKSESGFKIREGMIVGTMVTLRGGRMWSFLDKLVNVAFPRVRDFRGIPESAVDADGNFNYGFKEQLAFPEVDPDAIETSHGLQVSVTTTATSHAEGLALFTGLGFPFKKAEK
ncbi:MAG: 50S ribosomal protein L5 [Patescibacteria group bacterium]|nr:50S ribosomal protein L5 [Patescibacteria group bacterium]